jgi:hypothetical protein
MLAEAALPEDVLVAITIIDKYLQSLPDAGDSPPLGVQFAVFCSALIQFTGRHHLRYPIGDENG